MRPSEKKDQGFSNYYWKRSSNGVYLFSPILLVPLLVHFQRLFGVLGVFWWNARAAAAATGWFSSLGQDGLPSLSFFILPPSLASLLICCSYKHVIVVNLNIPAVSY